MILHRHIPFYKQIFDIPGFFLEPILVFGYQDIEHWDGGDRHAATGGSVMLRKLNTFIRSPAKYQLLMQRLRAPRRPKFVLPPAFNYEGLPELLKSRGYGSIMSLDLFDERADLRYDMNLPVPSAEWGRYGTLIDIGCLEHLFDTLQCLENCTRMISQNGHYMLHTPVNGYFGHGLHVFNPQGLVDFFEMNGFQIVYLAYSTADGIPVLDPSVPGDKLVWIVARKTESNTKVTCPQQRLWLDYYSSEPARRCVGKGLGREAEGSLTAFPSLEQG